jgi:hypothetical protein
MTGWPKIAISAGRIASTGARIHLRELSEKRGFAWIGVPSIDGLLVADTPMHFLAMHRHMIRTLKAKRDATAVDSYDGHDDVVADDDALSELAI